MWLGPSVPFPWKRFLLTHFRIALLDVLRFAYWKGHLWGGAWWRLRGDSIGFVFHNFKPVVPAEVESAPRCVGILALLLSRLVNLSSCWRSLGFCTVKFKSAPGLLNGHLYQDTTAEPVNQTCFLQHVLICCGKTADERCCWRLHVSKWWSNKLLTCQRKNVLSFNLLSFYSQERTLGLLNVGG